MVTTLLPCVSGVGTGAHVQSWLRNFIQFIRQLYFVVTDHCIECGKLMDEQSSYGIRCPTCEMK